MFKGESKNKVESPDRLNRLVTGSVINGDITTDSSLRLDGKIIGDLVCNGRLVVGESGTIEGNVQASELEINGKITGNIIVESLLTLHKTADVKGDIRTVRIMIEDGAIIEGNIYTGNLKTSSTPSPSAKDEFKESPVNI